MTLALLWGRKYDKGKVSSEFGGVQFDTIVSEDHRYTATTTNYPVEFGTIISDHIIKYPDEVTIQGMVSDTPLNILPTFNRSVAAFNQLVEIQARRIPVTVVTGIKVYTNMAITVLNVPRTIKTGQTLTFNIEFKKIIFDNTVQVELSNGNIFEGVRDNTPRAIVAENTNIPILQSDPAYSLKDQAESAVSVGVQSLAPVPPAVLPGVLNIGLLLKGIA
jgi:hypothetical protein